MTEQEEKLVNSIAEKLELIIKRENITTLMLSKLLKVDKQPLYRIMKREHIPNTYFLEMIGNYLNCSIIELLDDKFFLDINVYNTLNITDGENYKRYRIYIQDNSFINVANNNFFGINEWALLKVYYKVESTIGDGIYLISDATGLFSEINIVSAGSNLIIALIDNKEKRLNPKDINVLAKLYKSLPILGTKEYGKLL